MHAGDPTRSICTTAAIAAETAAAALHLLCRFIALPMSPRLPIRISSYSVDGVLISAETSQNAAASAENTATPYWA